MYDTCAHIQNADVGLPYKGLGRVKKTSLLKVVISGHVKTTRLLNILKRGLKWLCNLYNGVSLLTNAENASGNFLLVIKFSTQMIHGITIEDKIQNIAACLPWMEVVCLNKTHVLSFFFAMRLLLIR